VDEHVFADFSLGSVGEVDFFADAAKIDFPDAEGDIASIADFDYPAGNC
jgi:hypothetical protein